MAFNESDYIELIRKIDEILENDESGNLKKLFFLKKLMALYKKYPVYPSLAVKIFEQSQEKTIEYSDIEKGDVLLFDTDKETYLAAVKDINTEIIKLSEISKKTKYRNKTFEKSQLKTIYSLVDKQLNPETRKENAEGGASDNA